jgi:hypothetical protein
MWIWALRSPRWRWYTPGEHVACNYGPAKAPLFALPVCQLVVHSHAHYSPASFPQFETEGVTVSRASVERDSVVEDSAVVMVTEEQQEHMRDGAMAVRIKDVCEGDVDNTACRYEAGPRQRPAPNLKRLILSGCVCMLFGNTCCSYARGLA